MRYIKSFQNDAAIQAAIDDKSLGKPYVALNESAGTIDWDTKDIDYSKMPITFEIKSDGVLNMYANSANARYSLNGGDYVTIANNTRINLNVSNGDVVKYIVGHGGKLYQAFSGSTAGFIVYGKCEYGIGDYDVDSRNAFGRCTGLTDAENLIIPAHFSASNLAAMFTNCTSLVKAPKLPATTLVNNAYSDMFNGCTSLEIAPDLPATALTDNCYNQMFRGCTKLKYIKCLATTFGSNSTKNWVFQGGASSGTFVKTAGVTWSSGVSGIPSGWTAIEE